MTRDRVGRRSYVGESVAALVVSYEPRGGIELFDDSGPDAEIGAQRVDEDERRP